MQHVILTRFNIKDYQWRALPSSSWMDHRLTLFERLCFPSVESQSQQNFTWIVFVHPRTDSHSLRRLRRLQDRRFFELAFYETYSPELASEVVLRYAKNAERMITTRFDNDDALHSDYVNVVQQYLGVGRLRWLNFDQGLKLGAKGIYTAHHLSNAFLSRVECAPKVITALTRMHSIVHRTEEMQHVRGFRGWLQVIHGRNVANIIGGRKPTPTLKEALALLDGYCPIVCDAVKRIYQDEQYR